VGKDLQSAVFLPLSAQTNDPETVTWCRGVPLVVAEEFQQLKLARANFAAWTTGRGASLRLAHLQTAPPAEHVGAYARAARAAVGISGWGSWQGDPFLRWEIVAHDGDTLRKVPVDTRAGASRIEVVESAFETAKLILGLMDERPPTVLGCTESDQALLAWIQDRLLVWSRQRRGLGGTHEGEYRFLLSALTFDPGFHPAARQVIRRAGAALANADEPASSIRAIDALGALLRVRPDDHLSWTLLGMLQRATGATEDAIGSLRRAASLNAEYGPAHRELGTLFLARDDVRAAGAHLRKAGKLTPKDPEIQMALGHLYLALKDRSRAARHFQAVLRLATGSALAREASRVLLGLEDGPSRRPTGALPDVAPRPRERSKDRDLINRMFGTPLDLAADDVTSPGDDFLDRLDDEETNWDPDETVWDPE